MRKMIIGLLLAGSFAVAQDGTVWISNQDLDAGTLEISFNNSADVYGYQVNVEIDGLTGSQDDIDNVIFGAASGGLSEDVGFLMSTNVNGLVLAFSLLAAFIPAGNAGVLTNVIWDAADYPLSGAVTLSITNFAGAGGSALNFDVGATFLSNDDVTLVEEYKLSENYPNPFNPSTTIGYDVKEAGDVSIIVYDMLGREVRTLVNEYMLPNSYNIVWNGINDQGVQSASGVYYYKMISNDFVDTKKMMFVK
jgi:hypothetical protein